MTYFPLTQAQQEWQQRIADIADREVAPHADAVDKHRQFPKAPPCRRCSAQACGDSAWPKNTGGWEQISSPPVLSWKKLPNAALRRPCVTRCTWKLPR